jgi:hypothetical protein
LRQINDFRISGFQIENIQNKIEIRNRENKNNERERGRELLLPSSRRRDNRLMHDDDLDPLLHSSSDKNVIFHKRYLRIFSQFVKSVFVHEERLISVWKLSQKTATIRYLIVDESFD